LAVQRPKFCLSEIVRLNVEGDDRLDHSTAEVTAVYYMLGQRIWIKWGKAIQYTGWAYKVSTSESWFFEDQLNKTEQPDTAAWFADLMNRNKHGNPNKHRKNG
jgi:hypothetical protein